jgi:acetyltransferase EpsM
MPGVHISGNVSIGEGSMIGTGAVILPNVNVGKWCRIGAGAVVTRDVPDGKTFVGVPAKEL